jgi:hypothetical protein
MNKEIEYGRYQLGTIKDDKGKFLGTVSRNDGHPLAFESGAFGYRFLTAKSYDSEDNALAGAREIADEHERQLKPKAR